MSVAIDSSYPVKNKRPRRFCVYCVCFSGGSQRCHFVKANDYRGPGQPRLTCICQRCRREFICRELARQQSSCDRCGWYICPYC